MSTASSVRLDPTPSLGLLLEKSADTQPSTQRTTHPKRKSSTTAIQPRRDFMRIVATILLIALASSITACPAKPAPIGNLEITITGLPSDAVPAVTVTGPNNFRQTITKSGGSLTKISNLPVGSYQIVAADVTATSTYVPTVTGNPATVTANATSSVSVVYAVAQ
jgi:hypothetical protein